MSHVASCRLAIADAILLVLGLPVETGAQRPAMAVK